MSDEIAIRVRGLGKKYQIGGSQETYLTMRDAIVNSLKAPFKQFYRAPPAEEFWALKDVSFDVEPGEVVGIIGRNGAGKSTLLKILSRITAPTEGTVELYGRVGSLLEVGTGFHPEMTGRENIFLNGSILGMKKVEIEQKFDEIVKFAEIEKFLDTPVKRYSSGMYVRLAFAVAAHMDPEILVVDEVLAVGDVQFQKKCLGKMGEVAKGGKTVLFVSHNMGAIKSLCDRTIILKNGKIAYDGKSIDGIDQYNKNCEPVEQNIPISNRIRSKKISLRAKIIKIEIFDKFENQIRELDSSLPFSICLSIEVFHELYASPQINIQHEGQNILLFSCELMKNKQFFFPKGFHKIRCDIQPCFLASGNYSIACGLVSARIEWVDLVYDALSIIVRDFDHFPSGASLNFKDSIYYVEHEWNKQLNYEGCK
jgi:lipopolysaccharide transport system ATP-binding protein